jgi:hypothetical protein
MLKPRKGRRDKASKLKRYRAYTEVRRFGTVERVLVNPKDTRQFETREGAYDSADYHLRFVVYATSKVKYEEALLHIVVLEEKIGQAPQITGDADVG